MAKFYGEIGFVRTEENVPGVFEETYVERPYYGDVIKNARRWENGGQLNDDLSLNNTVSIVADDFAIQNLFAMRYVQWMGAAWKITNVEIQRPRIILTIGGVYNVSTTGDAKAP